jgi:protein-S-isoprenylcysteine O-methyltransferase Ste14
MEQRHTPASMRGPRTSRRSLALRAWSSLVILLAIMAGLLFSVARDISYWQGWAYLAVFGIASALTTLDLQRRDPALLERRLRAGPSAEVEPAQKIIMMITSLCFIALLIVPALDHRLGWSHVSTATAIAGDVMVAIGFFLIAKVYRANSYTSATIEVAADQTVVSTGPYGIVRHPMYASALLYFLGTPLALASWWAFIPIIVMMPALIWRVFDEERVLETKLRGYTEYKQQVRYRLIPHVW